MSPPQGAKPLGPAHFKPRSKIPLASLPATAKLGGRIASALGETLKELAAGPWRTALDGVEDIHGQGGGAAHALRFETMQGSIPAAIRIDATGLSALMEAVMGGSGSEEPFQLGDRPPSGIERDILTLAYGRLAQAVGDALAAELDRPVSVFASDAEAPQQDGEGEWLSFRILVNLYGYGGELMLMAAKAELAAQIKDAAGNEADSAAADAAQNRLQREVAKAELVFSACLAEQQITLQEMAALQPGSLLRLTATAATPVMLKCGGSTAFEGVLARSGDHLALTIRHATG